MSELLHVVIKDPENSGYVWDEFFCPECLDLLLEACNHLEVLRKSRTTPQYLMRIYPQIVNEPACRDCGKMFMR
jgi:hypothetical protein